MASSLAILSFLQLVALVCCVATADVKSPENTDEVEVLDTDGDEEDLETQETGWLIQEKMRQLEYFKNKFLSPFLGLKSPYTSYAGGYPGYSTSGGNKLSSSFYYGRPYYNTGGSNSYSTSFGGNGGFSAFGKIQNLPNSYPVFKKTPTFTSNVWSNKGFSGGVSQPSISSYAPDCDYTTGFKPSSYTPSVPTYSSGTPLYYYYSSLGGPSQTNAIPPSSSFSSSKVNFPSSVSIQPPFIPKYTSSDFVFKSYSPQYSFDSSQSFVPTSLASVPTASAPPSWSSATTAIPASPSLPSTPAPPSWSSISGSLPSSLAPPSWSSVPGSYPSSTLPPPPSTPAPPSWSSISGSTPAPPLLSSVISSVPSSPLPQVYSTPAPPYSYDDRGPQSYEPSPAPIPELYNVLPSTSFTSGQQNLVPSREVAIKPASPVVKGHFVTTLPGPKLALPEATSVYSPGSTYALSYYPNLFFITNEQHLDSPDVSKVSSLGQPSSKPTSTSSVGVSSDTSTIAPDTTTSPQKSSPSLSQVPSQPSLTTFYSSNTVDQTRIPIVYSIQQPVSPPANGIFDNYPVVPNAYPVSFSYISSQNVPQGVQSISSYNKVPSVNAYPLPLQYGYEVPNQVITNDIQAAPPTKTSLPGC